MGRMIGMMPLAHILIALGISKVRTLLKNIWLNRSFIISALTTIAIINVYRYFYIYPKTLPHQNTAFGRVIAAEIDKLPRKQPIYLIGCCWGEWGEPEPNGIIFLVDKRQPPIFIDRAEKINIVIGNSQKNDVILIASPSSKLQLQFQNEQRMLMKNGYQVAKIYRIYK